MAGVAAGDRRPQRHRATEHAERMARAQRVADELEHVADEDEVEVADLGRAEVVHAQILVGDPRAAQLGGGAEGRAAQPLRRRRTPWRASSGAGGVLPRGVGKVDGEHLPGAAAFELERPEAVHRADVEAAQALQRGRPRDARRRGAQVPAPGRDHARGDLDRVPPVVVGHTAQRITRSVHSDAV